MDKDAFVVKLRLDRSKTFHEANEATPQFLSERIETVQARMLAQAQAFQQENTVEVSSYEELKQALADRAGFVRCWFNEDVEAEATIKEETKGTVRCIPFDQPEGEGTCVYSGQPAKEQAIFAIAY